MKLNKKIFKSLMLSFPLVGSIIVTAACGTNGNGELNTLEGIKPNPNPNPDEVIKPEVTNPEVIKPEVVNPNPLNPIPDTSGIAIPVVVTPEGAVMQNVEVTMEVAKRDAQAYVIDWLEKSSRERNL
jgi:hypothetical protein